MVITSKLANRDKIFNELGGNESISEMVGCIGESGVAGGLDRERITIANYDMLRRISTRIKRRHKTTCVLGHVRCSPRVYVPSRLRWSGKSQGIKLLKKSSSIRGLLDKPWGNGKARRRWSSRRRSQKHGKSS